MTAAASSVSSAQSVTAQSLTELCQKGSPQQVLQALDKRKKPDQKTLEIALKRLQEANQRCGSYGPSSEHVSDDASTAFYAWEKVVVTLIQKKAPATTDARCIAHTIGRGLYEKLLKQEKTPKRRIERACEKFCAKTRKKIEKIKFAGEVFKAVAKEGLSKFGITKFDPYTDRVK